MGHWSVTSGTYVDHDATYLTWHYNFHGPRGLSAIVEFVEYDGSPELKIRAAANVPVTVEEMEIVDSSNDEEEEAV